MIEEELSALKNTLIATLSLIPPDSLVRVRIRVRATRVKHTPALPTECVCELRHRGHDIVHPHSSRNAPLTSLQTQVGLITFGTYAQLHDLSATTCGKVGLGLGLESATTCQKRCSVTLLLTQPTPNLNPNPWCVTHHDLVVSLYHTPCDYGQS